MLISAANPQPPQNYRHKHNNEEAQLLAGLLFNDGLFTWFLPSDFTKLFIEPIFVVVRFKLARGVFEFINLIFSLFGSHEPRL